jgi:hypothetical protein
LYLLRLILSARFRPVKPDFDFKSFLPFFVEFLVLYREPAAAEEED